MAFTEHYTTKIDGVIVYVSFEGTKPLQINDKHTAEERIGNDIKTGLDGNAYYWNSFEMGIEWYKIIEGRELTPEQETARQAIMDNLDHLTPEEAEHLLRKYLTN